MGELFGWSVGTDYHVDGCPEALLTPERMRDILLWSHWKRFGAPLEGGWADWPARLLDMLWAIDREDSRLTAERMKAGRND